jgi:murein DD-endopeptidase MepM/ murein hydrolase activator NlpD
VKGTRNGKPYWYLAQLPEIVKDALNYCGPGLGAAEWSYYRLPWPPGYPRVVGQANFSKPTHDGSQAYAFDFKLFNGGAIRAARGGTVIGLIEGYVMNVDPSVTEDDPSKWIPGNWLLIQHEDGTRSFYTHMQTNGVLVDVGDTVKRGDYIAIVGNTGNSSGPHLHFHVLDAGLGKDEGAAHGDPTIPIRFQTGPALLPHLSNKTCYLPQKGDVLTSNHPS